MANPPPNAGSGAGMPRWVKVFAIIVLAVVALFVVLLLTKGSGGHGPGRHMSIDVSGAHAMYWNVTEGVRR